MATKGSHRSRGEEGDHRPMGRLDRILSAMMAEVREELFTGQGRVCERMAAILVRPAQRIARVELESIFTRGQVGVDEINHVAGVALGRLFERSREYRPGEPVIPRLAEVVRGSAHEFAWQQSVARRSR